MNTNTCLVIKLYRDQTGCVLLFYIVIVVCKAFFCLLIDLLEGFIDPDSSTVIQRFITHCFTTFLTVIQQMTTVISLHITTTLMNDTYANY